MTLHSGQQFGTYEILKPLGSGGMGEVYLARDTNLNRQVAIKILAADLTDRPDLLARFRKEAGLAAVLNHPNICTIYEAGQIGAESYISMEYVEGESLRQRIAGQPLPLSDVLDIAIQIADALDEASKKRIVHRDIKSANIVLNARKMVKVLDFGLARQLLDPSNRSDLSEASTQSTSTQSGDIRGTVAYMSPEQALGKIVDHRSDIFSFGIVLYEMLTGRLPFTGGSTTEVVDAILHRIPVPVARYNDATPDALIHVLNKMLEKDADSRYQSVHEVWLDLRRIKAEPMPQPVTRSAGLQYAVLFLSVIVLVVAGVFYFARKVPTPASPASSIPKISIAVLPFRYGGDDPGREYLASMITDGLIASLQPVSQLAVAPYGAVREFSPEQANSHVAKELGVSRLVKGSVSVVGQTTKVVMELVNSDGKSLWTQSYQGPSLATLEQAKKGILTTLKLENSDAPSIERIRTPSVNAYRLYLEARNLQQGWDVPENLSETVKLYEQTLKLDGDFAAAHAGLARALLAEFHQSKDATLLSRAAEEANKAMALDSLLPEALIANGIVQLQSGRSIEAQQAFERALELAPGDDSACLNLARVYSSLGRNQEAEKYYLRAIKLRPTFWRNYYDIGVFQWQDAGKPEEARRYLEKAHELHPEGYTPLVMLGNINLLQGHLDKAETFFRSALEKNPNPYAYSNLGMVHYYRGQYDLALRNWEAVLKEVPDDITYRVNVAEALRQLHRTAEANSRYEGIIHDFRNSLTATPSDDNTRAGLAMALAAEGKCREAIGEAKGILQRHPDSPDLAAYGAITASRCGDLDMAKQIVLSSIAAENLLIIRFDPDLEKVRQLPEIQKALRTATLNSP